MFIAKVPAMPTQDVILITLIVYKIVLIGLGLYCRKKTHDGVDYFLGGRGLGPVVAAVSASASSSSAWTLLGVSGLAYSVGLGAIWLFPACVGGFALNWYVVAPRLRALSHGTGALTLTDVLARRSDGSKIRSVQISASLIVLVSLGLYVASQYLAAGKTFHRVFGIDTTTSILIGMAIVLVYTFFGGFWAVSLTDTLQGIVMAVAAIILPVGALIEVGGFGVLAEKLDAVGLLDPTKGLSLAAGAGFVLGLLGIGLGYPGQPHVVNRFMALEQGDAALRAGQRVAMVWAVIVYTGMIVLGLCARVIFPGVDDREAVFFQTATELFSPVVAGLIIAGVMSAVMSTADSQLLVAASSVSHDLDGGKRTGPELLRRSRIVVIVLGVLAVGLALVGTQQIFAKVLNAWSVMGAAFGPLLLLILFGVRVRPGARLAAILVGTGASLGAQFVVGPWQGVAQRVLPFLLAAACAWMGRERR